jgi:hypothetical protein
LNYSTDRRKKDIRRGAPDPDPDLGPPPINPTNSKLQIISTSNSNNPSLGKAKASSHPSTNYKLQLKPAYLSPFPTLSNCPISTLLPNA